MTFKVYYYDLLVREINARDMAHAATIVGQVYGGQAGIRIEGK